MREFIYILLILMLLVGCAPKVDYRQPELAAPIKWSQPQTQGIKPAPLQDARWWRYFNDPQLDSLIERASASNLDLRQADSRIAEARALRSGAEADLLPTVNANSSYSRNRRSENAMMIGVGGKSAGAATTKLNYNMFQAGFDASWELDLLGQARYLADAAQADFEAIQEARRGVMVSVLAEVARNYLELRGVQYQIAIIQKNLKAQQDVLHLTKARLDAGLGNQLDVARAQAQVAQTSAQLPTLETSLKKAAHRLGVLLGQEPGALLSELSESAPLPKTPEEILIGLPADLLRHRPDIRQAERELASSFAKNQASQADLYPQLSLTGNIGLQSFELSSLPQWPSKFWSFGPTVRFPLFNTGRIRANIKVQDARQEQALTRYEQTLLIAMEEVENALTAYVREQSRTQHLEEALSADKESLGLANELYIKGLSDFFPVLDAERSLYADESQLAQSQSAVLSHLVAVYKALGGGWEAIEQGTGSNLQVTD